MFQVHRIESLDLPELQPYRTLRRYEEHRERGLFVAEGVKVIRRLLESRFAVVSVVLPEDRLPELEAALAVRPEGIDVYVAPKSVLETLTGFSLYQGVLAVGRIPERTTLEDLLLRSPRPWLFVATDRLANAENLGVLVRNCAAFGAHGLIVDRTCSSPFLRRAVRNSMGAIFQLPVAEVADLGNALGAARAAGVTLVAAHPHGEHRALSHATLAGDCCLVFGNEGEGISAEVLARCDQCVAIPMQNRVDSLNVASAAAAFLYEAARQRGRA
jgi:tRNA G18 (ribose-2'-O)-methylase SpoU